MFSPYEITDIRREDDESIAVDIDGTQSTWEWSRDVTRTLILSNEQAEDARDDLDDVL